MYKTLHKSAKDYKQRENFLRRPSRFNNACWVSP